MITKVININLHQPIYEKLTAKQGDIASRYLLFHLLDGDKPFDLTGKSVRVYARKPDKTEIFNDLIINDETKGYCTLELTSQCLAEAGIVKMELYISQSGKVLTSIPFDLEVISCVNTINAIVSTNEFTALTKGLGSLNEYDKYKNEIIEARKGYRTVAKRLNNIDSQLFTMATKDELNALGRLEFSGEYDTLDMLNLNKPTGGEGFYLVIEDGYIYRWNGSSWIRTVQFKSDGIGDKSISINKLSDEIETAIYSKEKASIKFYAKYVESNGNISYSDGTIKSTEKIKYHNTSKITFSGDLTNKFYKISYYNDSGDFIKSTEWLPCNDFYIHKKEVCVISFKSNPLAPINPNEFIVLEVLYEKKNQDIISPQKIVSKYNLLDGLTIHEYMNISEGKDLNDYSLDGLLVNSEVAYVYDPIQVRNEGGLIYDELYISKTNDSGARQLVEYDINGRYIKTIFYYETEIDKLVQLDSNTFFIVVIGYYNTQSVTDYELHVGKVRLEWMLHDKIEENSIKSINIDGTYNLLTKLTVYDNKTVRTNTNLVNFENESILQDSSVAYCYSPLQIRNENGLIYGELYISTFASEGARQIGLYDKKGKWLGLISSPGESREQLINLREDAWYIVVIGYYNYEGKETFSVHPSKKKIEWLDMDTPENGIAKIETQSKGLYYEKVTPSKTTTELLDPYKYPLYPAWGHEYLYSWYEKLFNNQNVVISVDGDSTTQESGSIWTSVNGRRVDMVRKIMCTIGKYPTDKITINKNGYGSRTTGTWVGAYFNNDKPDDATNFPNGILDRTMSQNPDLIILGFGINDASTNLFPNTTMEYRLNQSKEWFEEGLKRIRGTESVNGRPAYNKSADELAIIICTPIQAENGMGRGRDAWQKYQREMLMELARKYNCAFYDVTARHWDHAFSGQWSQNNTTTERRYDKLHPMPACNADFMSGIQDLLFPICLWKWE